MTVKDFLKVTYDCTEIIIEIGIEEDNVYGLQVLYKGSAYELAKTELIDRKIINIHSMKYSVTKILIE
jgi:hypothetical protein